MKPRFEMHDNQLFRMLEEPVPLTPDAKFPCLCALTSFGEEGKCNIEKLGERRKDTANLIMAKSINMYKSSSQYAFVDGYMMNDKEDDFILQYYRFEIIGYPVDEGSHWWALYQMMQGEKICHNKAPSIAYCKHAGDIRRQVRYNCVDYMSYSAWLNGADKSGWQIYKEPESPVDPKERPLRNLILQAKEEGKNIRTWYQDLIFTPESLTSYLNNGKYRWWNTGDWELTKREANMPMPEPKLAKEPIANCDNCKHICTNSNIDRCQMYEPKPTFKVKDWVEFNPGNNPKQVEIVEIDGDKLYYNTRYAGKTIKTHIYASAITRKLSPSEVVLDFGNGIKGTVRSCEHDGGCVRVISGDRVIAHIITDVLEQPIHNLVRQLLKAQEEK